MSQFRELSSSARARENSSGDRYSSYQIGILEEDENLSKSSLTHSKKKLESEKFVPFINERSKMGRIHIESVKNLITKKGQLSNKKKTELAGKLKYQKEKL